MNSSPGSDSPLELSKRLINLQSITPDDSGCQDLIAAELEALGFTIERLDFDEVSNLWACAGSGGPLFVFAGHTDVVPPGSLSAWDSPPFEATEDGAILRGRGAADMKSSLAAAIVAVRRLIAQRPLQGRLGFLITSDEEGQAVNGIRRVMTEFAQRKLQIDYCLIGEPSSSQTLGDVIKVGRRGSLSARLTIKGIKGHVAYPHLADNPIHRAMPALAELVNIEWDQGNAAFPPTSLQISNANGGVGANNVIPEHFVLDFNLRYSTEQTADNLKLRIENLLTGHGLNFDIDWHLSGEPFLTSERDLIDAVSQAISVELGISTEESTAGGTSDGRFIAPTGAQVVELGPCNASIHKLNEHVLISDIEKLSRVYERIFASFV